MKVLRSIIWVLAAIGFLIFALFNWQPVEVNLWEDLVWETKLPVLAALAFVLGFVPIWAYHRSVTWTLNRRIRSLENSLKHTALARHHDPGPATAAAVDMPVEKPGTKPGEPADPLAPPDTSFDGAAK